jgi:predicted component of type VI protein secretion system
MVKYYLTGLSQSLSFELEPGFNTIGRNPTNDLRIRDATVSSFHCEIQVTPDTVLIRDLGSSNGTFVDDRPVQQARLQPGATLRLGSFELKLECRDEDEPARISVPRLPAETASVPVLLPDGSPACSRHSATHAAFQCTRCQKPFCSDCVRVLRLSGNTRVFCPLCSGICEPLPVPAGVSTVPPRKSSSILGRLTQTIRIRLK